MPGQDISGVALVQRHGSTAVRWAGGPADRSSGHICTPDTWFQICSVSKQFTATAILLMADRGRVALDDRVTRWFSDLPEEWRAITIRHLLTHTSGLGHWPDCPDLDPHQAVLPGRQMEHFQQMPLLNRPGTRWRYSSPGYVLLGWIVQEASGQPYAAFLADHIFAPLGLQSTSTGDPPREPKMAFGYRAGQLIREWSSAGQVSGPQPVTRAGACWSDLVRRLAGGSRCVRGLGAWR